MARTFTKNVSNVMSLGVGGLGSLLNGASVVSVHFWARYATIGTTLGHNRLFGTIINSTSTGGLYLSVHNGTSAVITAAARSQAADSFQVVSGTTGLSASTYYSFGAVYDFGAATITPYLNGTAEGGAGVTFGASTYTHGTPSIGDVIGGASASGSTTLSWDGEIAEPAFYLGDIGADGFKALAGGYSPKQVAPQLLVDYLDLRGLASPEFGIRQRLTGTITGSIPAAEHPRIIQPTSPRLFYLPAVISEAVGSSSGSSTAGADGASFAESEAASAGLAVASGVGTGIAAAIGSAAGTATVAGVGSTLGSVGAAAGTSTASGVGASAAESVGASTGVGSASGVGESTAESAGSAAGTAAADAVGAALVLAAGSSDGTSAVAGVGAALVFGVGSAAGTTAAAAVGESIAEAAGDADGEAIVIGFIEAQIRVIGESAGTSDALALGSGEGQLAPTGPWHDPYRTVIRVA